MKKYSKKLIFDYVIGNEVDNVDSLEQDYKFMMQVIDYTKDKKMYNLCSDEIKINYDFVKFMIDTFKDDKPFISSVANYYLERTLVNTTNYKEIVVMICDYIGNDTNIVNYEKFHLLQEAIYRNDKMIIESYKKNDKLLQQKLGLGFFVIIEEYNESFVLQKFFAKRFVDEIFHQKNNYTFEELIHINFKSVEALQKANLNTFLINYVTNYDPYLAVFLSSNLECFDDIKKEIKTYEKRFSFYLKNLNEERINIFYEKAYQYMLDNSYYSDKDDKDIITFVLKQQNLYELFLEDDYLNEFERLDLNNKNYSLKDFNKEELKYIAYLTSLCMKLFSTDVLIDIDSEKREKQKNDVNNTIKVDFKHKKVSK